MQNYKLMRCSWINVPVQTLCGADTDITRCVVQTLISHVVWCRHWYHTLCGADTDITRCVVQTLISHVLVVKKIITLLEMKFCWLLKAILLRCQLMTFSKTPTMARNLNFWQIQKIFLIQRPDWLCGTESLLLNGLRGYFPGVKGAVLEFYCSPQSTCWG